MTNNWGGLQIGDINIADFLIIGVPYDAGAGTKRGQASAPSYIRNMSCKLPICTRKGVDLSHLKLHDLGNVQVNQQEMSVTIKNIENKLDEINGIAKTIIIGGDHSITYPLFKKVSSQCNTGLIWFDAHPDVLDIYQNSKLSHGSPLRRIIEDTAINIENIMLVGTRFYELDEYHYIKSNQIYEIPAYKINDSTEYINIFSKKINEISSRVNQLYISIDIDVIDSGLLPGTGSPVTGGITSHQLFNMINLIPLNALYFDIVEYSPICDFNDIGARFILVLLSEILSNYYKGDVCY